MLTLSPAVRIYIATGATDLRRSIDGLSALVRERLTLDPLSGHLFLFRNRRGDRLKVLAWDRSGFLVLYKRLERGTFAWPTEDGSGSVEMLGMRISSNNRSSAASCVASRAFRTLGRWALMGTVGALPQVGLPM